MLKLASSSLTRQAMRTFQESGIGAESKGMEESWSMIQRISSSQWTTLSVMVIGGMGMGMAVILAGCGS